MQLGNTRIQASNWVVRANLKTQRTQRSRETPTSCHAERSEASLVLGKLPVIGIPRVARKDKRFGCEGYFFSAFFFDLSSALGLSPDFFSSDLPASSDLPSFFESPFAEAVCGLWEVFLP